MNVYSRTLPLPGAVRPVRGQGACALDRTVAAWPPPRPVAEESDRWAAPVGLAVSRVAVPYVAVPHAVVAPWPAPDPVMRFDLPAPRLLRMVALPDLATPQAALAAPRQHVSIPALQTASMAPPSVGAGSVAGWPAPTPDDTAPVMDDRPRMASRLMIGLAAAVAALAAGVAALVSLF